MTGEIGFTNNYQDNSTQDGFQFEFFCMRCGNGYQSPFQRSVGSVGRMMAIGGSLLGGTVGTRIEEAGFDTQWLKGGTRGKGWDKALANAVEAVKGHFSQCHRCGQWVCQDVCWNSEKGLCVQCAPKIDQEITAMQSTAQVEQLQAKVQQKDWTEDINYSDVSTAMCPQCNRETGGGKFCKFCGHPLLAAPSAFSTFCSNCGTKLGDANFCPECGASAN